MGLGAVLVEFVRRFRSREDRAALAAVAARDMATGEAAVIDSLTSAFTGTTGALRDEIERLQTDAGNLRQRAGVFEAELRSALIRVTELDTMLVEARVQIEAYRADVLRLRGERNASQERVVQQEGEIRQLNAVIDASKRISEK